jgi:hypothetical protein
MPDHSVLLQKVSEYYTGKLTAFGPIHRGVDWNSEESQLLRFQQLLKIIDKPNGFTINDYGCGYGALAAYLRSAYQDFEYHGFDISQPMIDTARGHVEDPRCTFSSDPKELPSAEYTVASGIFSVKLGTSSDEWTAYTIDTICDMAQKSTLGFAFNMLTRYSDPPRMRPDLYYADPHFFFDHCREQYSRRVAILHDYPLFEFTILVRL